MLGSVVASQDELHGKYGGVVPEIASRAHLERILPVIDETIQKSGIRLTDLDAVAVASTPGLAGSLLVGLVAAKTLCVTLDIPLIATNHLQAHIYACKIASHQRSNTSPEAACAGQIKDVGEDIFPCIGMIVSGGHTSLYRCSGPLDFELLGATIDDAAGEAFDKVASMLGLPYPGGPAIQRVAEHGDPKAYDLPRAMLHDRERLNFSFSGLKTAVRYKIVGPGKPDFSKLELSEKQQADLAASFQEAAVDTLVGKAFQALKMTGMNTLCIGGGVAANARFRERMQERGRLGQRAATYRTDRALYGQRRDGRHRVRTISGRTVRAARFRRTARRDPPETVSSYETSMSDAPDFPIDSRIYQKPKTDHRKPIFNGVRK